MAPYLPVHELGMDWEMLIIKPRLTRISDLTRKTKGNIIAGRARLYDWQSGACHWQASDCKARMQSLQRAMLAVKGLLFLQNARKLQYHTVHGLSIQHA